MSSSHAVTVAIKDRDGAIPNEIFWVIPGNIIPRFLWSSKPAINPGSNHTKRILNIESDEIISASAPGFFQELYLGGGYLGVILASFFYGLILGKSQKFIEKKISIHAAVVFSFVLFYLALRFDESHVVYSFSNLFFMLITFTMLFSVFNVVKKYF